MKKPKKVTVLLEPDIFDRFNTYCEENGCKKSSLLNRMIINHLDQNNTKEKNNESNRKKTVNGK